MQTIDQWFKRYGESHQNATNKLIHWICVPLITWSVLALLWAWTPVAALSVVVVALGFYGYLSMPIALGMLCVVAGMAYPLARMERSTLLMVGAAVFVLAWIGQFIGHRIEGRKPSFFDDLKFLLIGPAWLLGFIFRSLHIPY
jgi:uncharacterized membrane protein YGL010W